MTVHANERRSLVARAQRRTDQGGAAMVEYSLLLFAVLICAAAAIKTVGPAVACAGVNATDSLVGGMGGGGCEGATASAGGASGSDGATAGSSGLSDGTGGGADEGSSGGGGGGEVASSGGDDGTGGFQGGSGSSNSGSGSSGAASGSGSGSGSSGAASGGGGGALASSGSDGSGTSGAPTFGSLAAGTSPKAIDLTLAKLSDDVYGADKTPGEGQKGADGFRPLTSDELAKAGINQKMLRDPNEGFVGEVYTDGNGNYVVAIRGTKGGSGWKNNFEQGTGHQSAQYDDGLRLTQAAKAAFGNNVIVTGHSLGGGVAAAAAVATGLTAVTFNAAGVSDFTLAHDGVPGARPQATNGEVRAYEVQGEILSSGQEAIGLAPQALGKKILIQDPHPTRTGIASSLGLFTAGLTSGYRSYEKHSEFTEGMEKNPVIFKDASGKQQQYQFLDPSKPKS